eukprot:COSAG03_NODE_823_length_5728_cov_3.020075_2_plen_261_part_00
MHRVGTIASQLCDSSSHATSRGVLQRQASTSGTHSRQPIFHPEVLARFSLEDYQRDGYYVFQGAMTEEARVQWLEALIESDRRNNEITQQVDWRHDVDWASIGAQPPTQDQIDALQTRGGFNTKYYIGDAWWFERERTGLVEQGNRRLPFKPGKMPKSMHVPYVPANVAMDYHPFLQHVLTHPQMIQLHQLLLSTRSIRFDHCSLLVRKPGFQGQPTHSHAYGTPELEGEMGMRLVRTLCYPGGFGKDREGGECGRSSSD